MKPLIGITTGEIVNQAEPWASSVYGQKGSYSNAVIAAGGIPVFIPFMQEDELRDLYSRLDGLLFAGGNDIDPRLYGELQREETIDVSPGRDRVETQLMAWALADDMPIFAICRGFQLLNVHLGGSLHQHLLTDYPGASDHELSSLEHDYTHIAHDLKIAPNSRLASITGMNEIKANTHHHQGVNKLAKSLEASAWSEDGLIEAVEHPGKSFVLGVQCHPESLEKNDDSWARVFKAFVHPPTHE